MKYDVAVVGAGPAGAWTAHLLASRGARVVLADPSHPREKPCGGGVTGRALALVAPALAVDRLPAVSIRTARFVDTDHGGVGDACRSTEGRRPARLWWPVAPNSTG